GERMKMELIGALLHWPSVIFLDEPTIGLDILAAHKLREFLRVFNQREKATIILTSHNMEDIERLCSRVLILRSGEMIFDGDPSGLTGQGERELRVRFLKAPTMEELVSETSPDEEGEGDDADAPPAVHFTTKKDQIVSVLQKLMQKHEIVDMGVQ